MNDLQRLLKTRISVSTFFEGSREMKTFHSGRSSSRSAVALLLTVMLGCGPRHDTAILAEYLPPFDSLRGVEFGSLRSGYVRLFRAEALPDSVFGLHETIDGFSVTYEVAGYEGADGSWPREDALVLRIRAEKEFESNEGALAAFDSAWNSVMERSGVEPQCTGEASDVGSVRLAEWQRDSGFVLSVSVVDSAKYSVTLYRGLPCDDQYMGQ